MVPSAIYQIYPIGDQGITLDYGGEMNERVNRKIFQLYQLLINWHSKAVLDIIPAYHSISIIYDLVKAKKLAGSESAYQYFENKLNSLEQEIEEQSVESEGRKMIVPVCYDLTLAPDLQELANTHQLSVEEVIQIHSNKSYRIYMIGFLPGFAYMGTVDERITSPRRTSPRTSVPAGSVGIAGFQTGIYPLVSPGGWQLIGQTPLQIFDANQTQPTLLEPGDQVFFQSISLEEFHHLKNNQN